MKQRFLVEQHPDGKFTVHVISQGLTPYWVENKARAISGLNRTVVHVVVVEKTIDVPTEERT